MNQVEEHVYGWILFAKEESPSLHFECIQFEKFIVFDLGSEVPRLFPVEWRPHRIHRQSPERSETQRNPPPTKSTSSASAASTNNYLTADQNLMIISEILLGIYVGKE